MYSVSKLTQTETYKLLHHYSSSCKDFFNLNKIADISETTKNRLRMLYLLPGDPNNGENPTMYRFSNEKLSMRFANYNTDKTKISFEGLINDRKCIFSTSELNAILYYPPIFNSEEYNKFKEQIIAFKILLVDEIYKYHIEHNTPCNKKYNSHYVVGFTEQFVKSVLWLHELIYSTTSTQHVVEQFCNIINTMSNDDIIYLYTKSLFNNKSLSDITTDINVNTNIKNEDNIVNINNNTNVKDAKKKRKPKHFNKKKELVYSKTYQKFNSVVTEIDNNGDTVISTINNGFNMAEKKETLIFNGNTTICILDDGTKGIAKCNPKDKYNELTGIKIAYMRAKIISLQNQIDALIKSL